MKKYYKGFNENMQCRGFQYKEDKEYEFDGDPKLCSSGFHACEAPLDVLHYYPINNKNIYRIVECDGVTAETGGDSKRACKKIRVGADIGLKGLISEHIKYIQDKFGNEAMRYYSIRAGGDDAILAGTKCSSFAGGYNSNLLGSNYSTLAGRDCSNLIGEDRCELAGGDSSSLVSCNSSNLAGGDCSNLIGGNRCNLVGGVGSNLIGGNRCNLVGGVGSALSGGRYSIIVARHDSRAKAGLGSVIVLTQWGYVDHEYVPVIVKAEIVDGERIKADTWYELDLNGEFVELPTD